MEPEHRLSFNQRQTAVGLVIDGLLAQGSPNNLPRASYSSLVSTMPANIKFVTHFLDGALVVLTSLGLVQYDKGFVEPVSRHAYFALASLSKYLLAQTVIIDHPISQEEERYLIALTKTLETLRHQHPHLPKNPIHQRRIVNVLIKSRQNRAGRKQDVYLHIYHKDWGVYHLIGLSQKKVTESDEEVVRIALERQLGLSSSDYVIDDTFNPPEFTAQQISATSGALTEYTYQLVRIKPLKKRLVLKELQKSHQGGRSHPGSRESFRWFTLAEMERGYGISNEPIMFSSRLVMLSFDAKEAPVNAPLADDMRRSIISILRELGSRVPYWFVIIGSLILMLLLFALGSQLPNPFMNIVFKITGIIVFLIGAVISVYMSR